MLCFFDSFRVVDSVLPGIFSCAIAVGFVPFFRHSILTEEYTGQNSDVCGARVHLMCDRATPLRASGLVPGWRSGAVLLGFWASGFWAGPCGGVGAGKITVMN